MSMKVKLRGKLTALSLAAGLIPLIISILYLSHSSTVVLEDQAKDYLKSKVDGFARMAAVRYSSIEGNLDIIKEQLTKSLKADLVKEAHKEKYYDTGYMLIFSSDGTCVSHPKPEYIGNKNLYSTYDFVREGVGKKQGFFEYNFDGKNKWAYLSYNKDLDWIMWSTAVQDEVLSQITSVKNQMYVFLLIITIIVAVAGGLVAHRIARVANDISEKMRDIAQGDADLTVRLPVLSDDEVGDISHWFNEFVSKLEEVIMNVKLAAVQVDTATQEVSSGTQGLSQATQEQASAIEEVAATIEEMASSIKQNASNASQGREKAQAMVRKANESGEASQELVKGMGEISDASKKDRGHHCHGQRGRFPDQSPGLERRC